MIIRGVAVRVCTHVRKTGGRNARMTASTSSEEGAGQGGGRVGAGTWAPKGVGQRVDHRHLSQRHRGQEHALHVVITAQPEAECGQFSKMEHHCYSSGKALPARWKKWSQ